MALVINGQLKQIISRLAIALACSCLLFSAPVGALKPEQKKLLQSGVYYFDIDKSINCSSVGSINLTGDDNQERIYRYFVSQGLSSEQAAGITGNAGQESGYNPKAASSTGSYRGLFQWDTKPGGRWSRLEQHAKNNDRQPESLEAQLAFAWHEASERKNIDGIKGYDDVDHATWYWGRFYEVAIINGSKSTEPMTNVQHLDKRIGHARATFALYGNGSTSENSNDSDKSLPTAVNTSAARNCTGTGSNTIYADNFTYFSQYDPDWKDKKFGNHTIAEAGCGPTSMAMIITNINKTVVTPEATAKYATEKRLYMEDGGSKASVATELAAHWGLKAEALPVSVAAITQALNSGKLVFLSGNGPVPFTTAGHIIVIRAVAPNGGWLIADSAFELRDHEGVNEKEWNPDELIVNVKAGMVYAISK